MGIFGANLYETFVYGDAPRFGFSVLPFSAQALDYRTVRLDWSQPSGNWAELRILRSQDGFATTPEDGQILVNLFQSGSTTFDDTPETTQLPLVSGRFAYYRAWIYNADLEQWQIAGDAIALVPLEHSTVAPDGNTLSTSLDKLRSLLPSMYFNDDETSRDSFSVDPDTGEVNDLLRFLEAFSFTYDEFLTYADNILPSDDGRFANPELTELRTRGLGLELEPYIGIAQQKKLVREAIEIYKAKGTINAVANYAEALTGFAPEVSPSINLMPSLEDATFYKGTGYWEVVGDATLEVDRTKLPPTENQVPYAMDYQYSGLLKANGPAKIRQGFSQFKTRAVKVKPNAHYHFQTCLFPDANQPQVNASISITFMDRFGNFLKKSDMNMAPMAWGDWNLLMLNAFAPAKSSPVQGYSISGTTVTLRTIERRGLHQDVGGLITISGVDPSIDGEYTQTGEVEGEFYNEITYELPSAPGDQAFTEAFGFVTHEKGDAQYVGLEIEWDGANVTNIDMNQIAEVDHYASGFLYTYEEPRGVKVTFLPTKTNLLKCPNFSATGTPLNWDTSATGGAVNNPITLEGIRVGVGSTELEVTPNTAPAETVVSATSDVTVSDNYYSFSVYAKSAGTTDTIQLKLTANDGTSDIAESISENLQLTDEFQRFSVRLYVPESENVTITSEIIGASLNDNLTLASAQLEASYNVTDYFDGGLPESYGADWAGDAGDSVSYIYPNKFGKCLRTAETLKNFVPFDCPIVVETLTSIERKVFPLKLL